MSKVPNPFKKLRQIAQFGQSVKPDLDYAITELRKLVGDKAASSPEDLRDIVWRKLQQEQDMYDSPLIKSAEGIVRNRFEAGRIPSTRDTSLEDIADVSMGYESSEGGLGTALEDPNTVMVPVPKSLDPNEYWILPSVKSSLEEAFNVHDPQELLTPGSTYALNYLHKNYGYPAVFEEISKTRHPRIQQQSDLIMGNTRDFPLYPRTKYVVEDPAYIWAVEEAKIPDLPGLDPEVQTKLNDITSDLYRRPTPPPVRNLLDYRAEIEKTMPTLPPDAAEMASQFLRMKRNRYYWGFLDPSFWEDSDELI